ncbi:MAG: hypothetical protein ACUZ8E_15700 [Candidatus Anammoxibacter sp.]
MPNKTNSSELRIVAIFGLKKTKEQIVNLERKYNTSSDIFLSD